MIFINPNHIKKLKSDKISSILFLGRSVGTWGISRATPGPIGRSYPRYSLKMEDSTKASDYAFRSL
jgi:hypothetical protein